MFGRSREEKEYQARAEQRQAERVLHPALFEPFFNTRSEPLEDLAKAEYRHRRIHDPAFNVRLRQAAALLEAK